MKKSSYLAPVDRYGEKLYAYARNFREIALIIDQDPSKIKNYFNLPAIDFLVSDKNSTALERTCYLEAFSYGDLGVLLASPGPSLSGLMLRELGSQNQIDEFYSEIQSKKMRTFFGLTEPKKGSDANNIDTQLIKKDKSYFLTGEKCFFGNGAVAETGIVLARINDGPVGIRAIWLKPALLKSQCIEKQVLPMASLKGAQISYMRFSNLEVPESLILGGHKSVCQNGLLSILKVFNQLRTGVGALAIGQAQAVYDLVLQLRKSDFFSRGSFFDELHHQLTAARRYLHFAADSVDKSPLDFYHVSASKVMATRTAETVISACYDLCDINQLIENPWIVKAYRDVFCWEFMEGTTMIQKIHLKKRLKEVMNGKLSISFAA
ncbi:MAG: acyl-CoA dehydrogenase family protein [Coxiellaceae bacterium]|nr:acyl-CoA dehydrogenase family protein [Coxiellaceae bacterium]